MIAHQKSFKEAIGRTYHGALFDIDGTLAEVGTHEIPMPLKVKLAELSRTVPMGFCTGRRFDGILEKLQEILDHAEDEEASRRNWYLFLENASIGVRYNPTTKAYERFYEFLWPEKYLAMRTVYDLLEAPMKALDDCELRMNECNVGVYVTFRERYGKAELRAVTAKMAHLARELLTNVPGAETFHVVDSGVAVHVISRQADKDTGIREFAKILRQQGYSIGPEAREILVVGDQPGPGYNDEKLLEGKWGTPFTADMILPDQLYPIPIFEGERMLSGPDATLSLLNRIPFGGMQ